jgi:putative SbcD/Mre11-related phosphoesterase
MTMDKSRREVQPGVWLDARRCLFLERERVLAVSDLHLGYAWAHRFSGQLMPLPPEDAAARLGDLCAAYRPQSIALLGDIVHRAAPVAEIRAEVLGVIETLRQRCGVKLVLGNHDKGLARILCGKDSLEFADHFRAGSSLLVHGNQPVQKEGTERIVMGHEHPAISLGDGVRSARFPCFLVAHDLIVLPAFSRWAAGADIRAGGFLSPLARGAGFHTALAIMNGKLLPVPLRQ